ncbi:MAG TPA: hypothetical protein VGR47_20265 [Terracidiphilus sp.]|nr:hypothetical protein [Terracidiphilus sp.]
MDHFVVGANANAADEAFVVTLNLTAIVEAVRGNNTDRGGLYQQLVSRAYTLLAEVDAAIAQINSDNLEYLLPKWEDAKAIARQAKGEFETAFNQRLRFMNGELDANNKLTNAVKRLSLLKNNPPNPNSYPTADELAAWKQSVADGQAAVDKLHDEAVGAARESQLFFADLNERETRLNTAARAELELRQKVERLQGKPASSVHGLPTVVG